LSNYEYFFGYFGLRENPFHISPDPRFYFPTLVNETVFAELLFGIQTRQGLVALTGEAGTGKTTLINSLLEWLRLRGLSSAYVFHPMLKPVELFDFIARDFGISCPSNSKGDILAALHQWLLARHSRQDCPVVIIDEAQSLPASTLDELRLLLNLETSGAKLVQIVLAGPPDLDQKLRLPELLQLRQRVVFHCRLGALSLEQTAEYIRHRLAVAGSRNPQLFDDASMRAIHFYSKGLPRIVNLLCEHALIAAYSLQQFSVSSENIHRIAASLGLSSEDSSMPQEASSGPQFGRLIAFPASERVPAAISQSLAPPPSAVATQNVAALPAPSEQQSTPAEIVPLESRSLLPVLRPKTGRLVRWLRQRPPQGRFTRYCKEVTASFVRDFRLWRSSVAAIVGRARRAP
jgi:general secretion pathway protein A